MVRNYIGGQKVEQKSTKGFRFVDWDIPITIPSIREDRVPIGRASGYGVRIRVDDEIPQDLFIEHLLKSLNEILQSFLENNQDKILLENIKFEYQHSDVSDTHIISIPNIRAISVNNIEYMDHVRRFVRERRVGNEIIFPRLLIANESR